MLKFFSLRMSYRNYCHGRYFKKLSAFYYLEKYLKEHLKKNQ